MSVAAALALPQGVYFAADTLNNVYQRPVPRAARKLRRLRAGDEDVLAAFAGHGGLPTVLAANSELLPAVPRDREQSPHDWAHSVAYTITEEAHRLGITNSDGQIDASILLGWNGHVWTLTDYQAIPHRDGVGAIGCGEEIAIGALEVLRTSTDLHPLDQVRRAVEIACKYDRYCGEPIDTEALPTAPAPGE